MNYPFTDKHPRIILIVKSHFYKKMNKLSKRNRKRGHENKTTKKKKKKKKRIQFPKLNSGHKNLN